MQGLKVSYGMHQFGERRWRTGIVDDFRSVNDQNTRVIGDFTKMIRTHPIAEKMIDSLLNETDWKEYFKSLLADNSISELNENGEMIDKLLAATNWFAQHAPTFRRQSLQTRFFETGDNYYLGMELPREYQHWKRLLLDHLLLPLRQGMCGLARDSVETARAALSKGVDRLWYHSVLETIRTGDVYNPGARHRVPRLNLIPSFAERTLSTLQVGEPFRRIDSPDDRFEVVGRGRDGILVRNPGGRVSSFPGSLRVSRDSDLTRAPDGVNESKVVSIMFLLTVLCLCHVL